MASDQIWKRQKELKKDGNYFGAVIFMDFLQKFYSMSYTVI